MTDRESDAATTPHDADSTGIGPVDAATLPGRPGIAHVAVPDVPNFRDAGVGGLRTGRLFRSGALSLLTPEGAQRLKALGVRSVIDLRTSSERSRWPDERHGLDYTDHHHPVLPDRAETGTEWPTTGLETYVFMAETGGHAITGAVRRIAAPGGLPAIVHCAVGKDRTGITIAVLHHLAGLPDDEIVTDFLRSNAHLGLDRGPVTYLDENGEEQLSHPVETVNLLAALDRMRELHGSIEGYLLAHGATRADLDTVRAALTP
ncbi:tyrosine-protein phosphatase [Kitasatospora sp. NBC_01539]|uniref:tyrosine-protein phosphatase n=1 Tax=Kitasatospora sp. NBC_01539 TaxID=2903577 RepID=UPI0038601D5A